MQASSATSTKGDFSFFLDLTHGQYLISGILTSLILVTALLVLRHLLIRVVRGREEILSKDQRRWLTSIRNTVWIALIVGLIFIWAPQIQTLAFSLTAFVVAMVIATKEYIMCFTGGLLRTSTRPFKVGNWITVSGISGEVTDMDAFAVRLQEVDISGGTYQFTGQTFIVPNSVFLSANVENLTFTKQYVNLSVPVSVDGGAYDPQALMDRLKETSLKIFAPLKDEAVKFNRRVERKSGVDLPDPEPHFFMKTTDSSHIILTVRMLVPTLQAAQIASEITSDLLSYAWRLKRDGK